MLKIKQYIIIYLFNVCHLGLRASRALAAFSAPQNNQKPSFAKVPKTPVKPHFWSQIAVLPSRHKCCALAANFSPEARQIICLTRFAHGASKRPTKAQFRKPSFAERVNKLYDRNLGVQIFQKVRCTLCSLSTKRSLPWRSGRSPLG